MFSSGQSEIRSRLPITKLECELSHYAVARELLLCGVGVENKININKLTPMTSWLKRMCISLSLMYAKNVQKRPDQF